MPSDYLDTLAVIVAENCDPEIRIWLDEKIEQILSEESTRTLYLTYSLCGVKNKRRGT